MDVYVMLVEDRHTDPDVSVYASLHEAIEAAASYIDNLWVEETDDPEIGLQELNDGMLANDWVWYYRYSLEGDSVTVLRREMETDRD